MKAAVLGSPVSHSLSPALHRAAYTALGLRGWSYVAIDCDQARLPGVLRGLDHSWAGVSLTMPLKRAALALLDETDEAAAAVGGANTVVLRGGRRCGYNTDIGGMVDALGGAGVSTCADVGDAGAMVIGAGATACSALAALRQVGITKATVAVRSASRAGELLGAAQRLGVTVWLRDLPSPGETGRGGAVPDGVAAGTSPSTAPPDPIGLAICTIPPNAADAIVPWLCGRPQPPRVVFDVAYDPWPTRLAAAAAAAGSTVIGGFELLLHQAGRQVELMTGHRAPLPAMREAGLAELASRAVST